MTEPLTTTSLPLAMVLEDWRLIAAIIASTVAIIGGAFGGLSKLRTFLREQKTGFDVRVDTDVFTVGESDPPSYHVYVRLWIRARARGAALTNVQARLVSSNDPPRLGGKTPTRQREFYLAFRTAHDHQASMPLSPGEARHVDLLLLRSSDPPSAVLTFATTPSSPKEGYLFLPGTRVLGVRVTAAETRAREFEITVDQRPTWNGEPDAGSAVVVELKERPSSKPEPPPAKTN